VTDDATGPRYPKGMQLTVQIPDDLAGRLGGGSNLSRRMLEVFAREEHKNGRITRAEARRLLGIADADLDQVLGTGAPSPVDDSVAAAARRLASFGTRHGLSLGGMTIKELLRESRP
jgi:hypothetical protein